MVQGGRWGAVIGQGRWHLKPAQLPPCSPLLRITHRAASRTHDRGRKSSSYSDASPTAARRRGGGRLSLSVSRARGRRGRFDARRRTRLVELVEEALLEDLRGGDPHHVRRRSAHRLLLRVPLPLAAPRRRLDPAIVIGRAVRPLADAAQIRWKRAVRPRLVVAGKRVRPPAAPPCGGVGRVNEDALLPHRNQQGPPQQACGVAQPSGDCIIVQDQGAVAPRRVSGKLVGVNDLAEGKDVRSRLERRIVHPWWLKVRKLIFGTGWASSWGHVKPPSC